nr:ribonuclease H-like domain, reverse transcriptase, RNA-dependent DNA polymerase [Tanacetum cinerariifolium]
MKKDETIDTFTTKLTTLVNKEASLGHTMEDRTLVRKLLNAIPDRYLQIVASIEQNSSEMTLEETIGRLKTYEERIKYKKGKQVDNQEKLMFTQHKNKGKYFRGCGRGKHRFSQGRNHENFKKEKKDEETSHKNFNKNNFKKSSYYTSKLQCYKCKKIEDEEQKVSLHEEDVGYKETNKDSLWYLDNRASNHMIGVREHFKELNEKVSGKVRFGDGSYIEIKGKDKSPIEGKSKDRDVKFKDNETWDWKDYMSEHINDEPEWTDFKIGNLEVTNEHHDQGFQPIEEDNEFPNNDDDDYASLTRDSPTHSQTPHTPSTCSSEVNSQVTPNISTQSNDQSDNVSIQTTNSPSHFDHTPEQNQGKVYRLIKALYRIRQAPCAWNIKLDNTLKSLGFKKCPLEQSIYTKTSKDSTLLTGVYVDDLIIIGTPKKEIDKFKAQMEKNFEMSDLGLLAYYLGIEVKQTNGDISIRQSAYANKIIKEAGMIDCNETLIPMDPGKRLTKVTEGTMVNSTEYRSIIGCLRYLLHIRPDLSYSVGLLSHFMQEPREQHMKSVRQVLRYVKGTKDHRITYKNNGGNKIHGYSDSSYGVNTQEGKETTGIIFYYATAAATQALWLKRLLSKLKHSEENKVTIRVDNKSAIALMKNPVFHGRSKHIDMKYHFIRECVEREDIQVEFVSGEYQKADILTKALPKIKFLTMR